MSDQHGIEATPSTANRRRSSIASIMDMFAGRSSGGGTSSPPGSNGSFHPGPITQAAAQAHHRRLSIANPGGGSSPTQPSHFDTMRSRTQSISGSSSGSLDESPFEDNDGPSPSSSQATPFARRVSFGAQAMRDMRGKSGSAGSPSGNANDGFNFAENMRARAERGSMSASSMSTSPTVVGGGGFGHGRAKSVAVMEPPVREMPTQPRKPDHFQERILKGDFYMD